MMLPDVGKIVVPTDFAHSSRAALEIACRIAHERNAEVILFHAFEPPVIPASVSVLTASEIALQERHANDQLRILSETSCARGARVKPMLRRGAPAEEILRFVDESHADLVILGMEGRTPHENELGAVAGEVVRACRCPILLVPPNRRGH